MVPCSLSLLHIIHIGYVHTLTQYINTHTHMHSHTIYICTHACQAHNTHKHVYILSLSLSHTHTHTHMHTHTHARTHTQIPQHRQPNYQYIPNDYMTYTLITAILCGFFSPLTLMFTIPAYFFSRKVTLCVVARQLIYRLITEGSKVSNLMRAV